MAKQFEIYSCGHCGNVLEVLSAGGAVPQCCGEAMRLMVEGQSDGAQEKHVPVVVKTPNGYSVKVGAAPHPMEEKHWIQWIELLADGIAHHKFLKPGESPVATFCVQADAVVARAYCNLHGHWKS